MVHPNQPFFLFHSAQAVHLPSLPSKSMKGKTEAGPHGDFIFQFDYTVGKIVEAVEQLGIAENTLIIVTSDNGPEVQTVDNMQKQFGHNGAHPWRGVKRDQWEGGHRVPFLVQWPARIKTNRVIKQAFCQTDLMHTFASIVGYELPENAAEDSFDFSSIFIGEDEGTPIRPFILHQTQKLELAIRTESWKYLDHQGSGGNDYSREKMAFLRQEDSDPDAPAQLYNLCEDPGETKNLHALYPEKVKQLKELLEDAKLSGRSR